MVNASPPSDDGDTDATEDVDNRIVAFAAKNKTLINALLRSNPALLEKGGLRAMVKIPKCRVSCTFLCYQ